MGKGGTTSGTTHVNNIELKLTFLLADGNKIAFVESLYPWQEIPQNWEYELFVKSDYKEINFVKKLKTYRTILERSLQ